MRKATPFVPLLVMLMQLFRFTPTARAVELLESDPAFLTLPGFDGADHFGQNGFGDSVHAGEHAASIADKGDRMPAPVQGPILPQLPRIGKKIIGTSGKDTLKGAARKSNLIRGKGAADKLTGNGEADIIFGNWGADVIQGGDEDLALVSVQSSGTGLDNHKWNVVRQSYATAEFLYGGPGDDKVFGGDGFDIISDQHLLGDDLMSGGAGFDLLLGGSGNDKLIAGDGPKEDFNGGIAVLGGFGYYSDGPLKGAPAALNGGMLRGGPGRDILILGSGRDLIVIRQWEEDGENVDLIKGYNFVSPYTPLGSDVVYIFYQKAEYPNGIDVTGKGSVLYAGGKAIAQFTSPDVDVSDPATGAPWFSRIGI